MNEEQDAPEYVTREQAERIGQAQSAISQYLMTCVEDHDDDDVVDLRPYMDFMLDNLGMELDMSRWDTRIRVGDLRARGREVFAHTALDGMLPSDGIVVKD